MITLKEYISEKLGFVPTSLYNCPGCSNKIKAFALTRTADFVWRCGHCQVAVTRINEPPHILNWDDVRGHRRAILSRCDWTQLPDVPAATRQGWATFRQTLRDITDLYETPQEAWDAMITLEQELNRETNRARSDLNKG